MASVNKAIILGNLGADPEFKMIGEDRPCAQLSIATTRTFKNANGERTSETEWHRVVLFGRTAEVARDYLKKGSPAYIEGRIRTRKYTDKNGIERYTTEIVGDNLQLLGSKSEQESTPKPASKAEPHNAQVDEFEDVPW